MKILLSLFCILCVVACAVSTVPVEIAADTITTSAEVDKAQELLGEYADQDTQAAIDELQADITEVLTSGSGALEIDDYHNRAVALYLKVSAEVAARADEMTEEQKDILLDLDARLVDLNTKIETLKAENPTGAAVLEALSTTATILKFYAVI